jgi:hypothetical protein
VNASDPRHLLAAAGVGAVLGFVVAKAFERSGGSALPVPWTALLLLAAIAVAVLVVAWPVRRWNHGRRDRRFDALRAARAAVLAKAASHSGAALMGWFAGQGLAVAGDLAIEPRRDRFTLALAAVLLAAAVTAAGLVAERWCRRRPDDDE